MARKCMLFCFPGCYGNITCKQFQTITFSCDCRRIVVRVEWKWRHGKLCMDAYFNKNRFLSRWEIYVHVCNIHVYIIRVSCSHAAVEEHLVLVCGTVKCYFNHVFLCEISRSSEWEWLQTIGKEKKPWLVCLSNAICCVSWKVYYRCAAGK